MKHIIFTAAMLAATAAQADPNAYKHAAIGWSVDKLITAQLERTRPNMPAKEVKLVACGGAFIVGGAIELVQGATGTGVADWVDFGITGGAGCTGLLPDPLPQVVDASVAIYAAAAITPGFAPFVAYVEYIKAYHPERIESVDAVTLQEELRMGK